MLRFDDTICGKGSSCWSVDNLAETADNSDMDIIPGLIICADLQEAFPVYYNSRLGMDFSNKNISQRACS